MCRSIYFLLLQKHSPWINNDSTTEGHINTRAGHWFMQSRYAYDTVQPAATASIKKLATCYNTKKNGGNIRGS